MKDEKTTQSVRTSRFNLAGLNRCGGGILLGLMNVLSRWLGLLRETMFLIFLSKNALDTVTLALSVSNTTKKIAAEGFMEYLIIPGLGKFEDNDNARKKWLYNMLSFVMYLTFGIACIVCGLSPLIANKINKEGAIPNTILLNSFCIESIAICLYILGNFATALLYKINKLSHIGLSHLLPSITQSFLLVGFYKYIRIESIFLIIIVGVIQSVVLCYVFLAIYKDKNGFAFLRYVFNLLCFALFSISSTVLTICVFSKVQYGDLFAIISEASCAACGYYFAGLFVLKIIFALMLYVYNNIDDIICFKPRVSSIIFMSIIIPFFLHHMSFSDKRLNAIFIGIGMFFAVIHGIISLSTSDFNSFPLIISIRYIFNASKLALFSIMVSLGLTIILTANYSVLSAFMMTYILIFTVNRAAGHLHIILDPADESTSKATKDCLSNAPDVFIGSSAGFLSNLISNIAIYNLTGRVSLYLILRNEKILNSVYIFFHSISFLIISDIPDQIANKKYDLAQKRYNITVWVIIVLMITISGVLLRMSNKMSALLVIFSRKSVANPVDSIYVTCFKLEMFILPALCIKAILSKLYFAHSMPKFVAQAKLTSSVLQVFLRFFGLLLTQNMLVLASIGIFINYMELIYLFLKSNHLKINAYYPFTFWKKWFYRDSAKASSNIQ